MDSTYSPHFPEFSFQSSRQLGEQQLQDQPYAPRSPTPPNLDGTNYNFNFSYPPAGSSNFNSITATPPTPFTHITTDTTSINNFHYPRTQFVANPSSNLYTLPASPALINPHNYSSRPLQPPTPQSPLIHFPPYPHPTALNLGLISLTHPPKLGVQDQIFSNSNNHEDILNCTPHSASTELSVSQVSPPPTKKSSLSPPMMSSSAQSNPRGSSEYIKTSNSNLASGLPPSLSYPHFNNFKKTEIKTKFPVARIKRIMQADEEVGKVAQVTPVAVSKALELFMIALVSCAAEKAREKGSKKVNAQHLKMVVEGQPERFDFLAEIVGRVGEVAGAGHSSSECVANEGIKSMRKRKEDSESASDDVIEREKVKKKGRGRKKKNPD